MKLRLMISTLCVASIAMAGCASKVTQPDEYSGFLSDYSQLKELSLIHISEPTRPY